MPILKNLPKVVETIKADNCLKSVISVTPLPNLNPVTPVALTALTKQGQQPSSDILETWNPDRLLTPEEIQLHSLLQQPIDENAKHQWEALINKLTNTPFYESVIRVGAHFAGSGLVTGDIKGMQEDANFGIWVWLIEDLIQKIGGRVTPESALLQDIAIGLKRLKTHGSEIIALSASHITDEMRYQAALKNAEKVKLLKASESELFYGGYTNTGANDSVSHAQIYEFIRNEDLTFDINVYTSTHFQLADTLFKGTKLRINPIVHFHRIPEQKLLFNGDGQIRPCIIAGLAEQKTNARVDSDRVVDDEDILQVFDSLAKYRPQIQSQECGTITGQRGNSCVPAVTKVWIRKRALHVLLYKQLMFHCKLKIFAFCHLSLWPILDDDTKTGERARTLLVQLARNIMRSSGKMISGTHGFGPLIDQKLTMQAQATAQDSLNIVADCVKNIILKRMDLTVPSDLSQISVEEQRLNRSDFSLPTASLPTASAASPVVVPNLLIRIDAPTHTSKAQALLRAIENTNNACERIRLKGFPTNLPQEIRTHGFKAYNQQIHQLLDQIPLPKIGEIATEAGFKVDQITADFWNDFSLKELEQAQLQIFNLLNEYYLPSKFYQLESLSRRFATILPLHVLLHFLALKIEAKRLSTVPTNKNRLLENYPIPSYLDILEIEGLQFFDRNEFERIRQATEYIQAFNNITWQYGNTPLFRTEKKTEVNKSNIKECPATGLFWEALLESDPNLAKLAKDKGEEISPELLPQQIAGDFQAMVKAKEIALLDHKKWEQEKQTWEDWKLYQRQEERWKAQGSRGPAPIQPSAPPILVLREEPKPIEPDTKKNLSPQTKAMLALGAFDSSSPNTNLLVKAGYTHLYLLRHMAHMSRHSLYYFLGELSLKQIPKRTSPYNYEVFLEGVQENDRPSTLICDKAWENQRPINQEHKSFLTLPQASRLETNWSQEDAEGRALIEKKCTDNLLKRILRTLSQPDLVPNQIIYELSRDFKRLQDPSLQSLIFYLFFRSPALQENRFSPIRSLNLGAGNLIVTNPALFDNVLTFINKGLRYSYKSDKTLSTGRFFFELSFYLCKFLVDANQIEKAQKLNQLPELNRWLEKQRFTDQDRSALHLYRVCFYSLLPPNADPTPESAADIYASWCLYKLNPPLDAQWKFPDLANKAEMFINALTCRLWHSLLKPAFYQKLGSDLFSLLNLDSTTHQKPPDPLQTSSQDIWQDDPILSLPYISCRNWKIDLIMGKVYHELGEIQGISGDCPWEQSDNFKRLFRHEKGFTYRAVGAKCVLFTHPQKGTFRLIPTQAIKPSKPDYHVHRKLTEKEEWYHYCPPASLKDHHFPKPLIYDHAYWMPEGGITTIQGHEIKGLITSLKSQQIRYAVLKDGLIVEADERTGVPKQNGYRLDYLVAKNQPPDSPEVLEGFARFDDLENIVTYRDTHGRLDKIVAKRYTSLDGNPLMFLEQKGRFVFSENRDYAIPKRMPKCLLGTIENYIFLEAVKDPKPLSGILLVPLQTIELKHKTTLSEGTLMIHGEDPSESQKKKKTKNEWNNTQKYLVFKAEGGDIMPTGVESVLFLSYILLSQKDPEAAIHLLRSVKPIEVLSPLGMEILDRIQDLPIVNDHPDFKMVKLHALALQLRQRQQESKEPIEEYFSDNESHKRLAMHIKNLKVILQGNNNISHACRFTKEEEEEEIELLKILKNEASQKLNELEKNDPEFPFCYAVADIQDRIHSLEFPSAASKNNFRAGKRYKWDKKGYDLPFSYSVDLVDSVDLPPKKGIPDYDNKLAEHKTKLDAALSWIHVGQSDFDPLKIPTYPYTRPPATMKLDHNGKLFLEILHLALSHNDEAIREMLFRLKMWREQKTTANAHLDCMIMILKNPQLFVLSIHPSLFENSINTIIDYEKKYSSLKQIEFIYNNHRKPNFADPSYNYPSQPTSVDPSIYYQSHNLDFSALNHKRLEDVALLKQPFKVNFGAQEERWSLLKAWKDTLIPDPLSKTSTDYQDFEFKYREGLLSPTEKIFEESLKNDLELFQADYDKGKELNDSIQLKTLPSEKVSVLKKQVEEKLAEIAKTRKETEIALLKSANQKKGDAVQRAKDISRVGGKVEGSVTLQDCVDGVLAFDKRKYLIKNPQLEGDENDLANLTLRWVDTKSYDAQLHKILSCVLEIQEVDLAPCIDHATRRSLCKKLEDIFDGAYHFDKFNDETQACLRVFCGQTGDIPYKIQTDLIEKMLELEEKNPQKFKDIIIQLIMGGGKTAVIATIILFLSAKSKGRLAFFIVPPAHFNTFSANFSESMLTAFGKHVLALNLCREDFTLYKLENTLKLLNKARDEELPVNITAITLLGMELEELSISRKIRAQIRIRHTIEEQYKNSNNPKSQLVAALKTRLVKTEKDIKTLGLKVALIAQLLTLTTENAASLLDELEQILDCYLKLTFVDGKKTAIDPLHNQLMLMIYKGLCSKSLKVETLPTKPLLRDVVRVHHNNQTLLSEADYLGRVTPALARYLATNFQPILPPILPRMGDAFCPLCSRSPCLISFRSLRIATHLLRKRMSIGASQNLSDPRPCGKTSLA